MPEYGGKWPYNGGVKYIRTTKCTEKLQPKFEDHKRDYDKKVCWNDEIVI